MWRCAAARYRRRCVAPSWPSRRPWGAVDVFRIAGGKVVERWSHTDGTALIRPLAQAALDLPTSAPGVVTIDRLTLAAGAQWSAHATGQHLLYVEEGRQPPHPRGEERGVSTDTDTSDRPLAAGQSLVMPAGAGFDMTNVGTAATRSVVVTVSVPQDPGEHRSGPPPEYDRKTLAGGMAADVGIGPTVLTLEQMILARGAQLSMTSVEADPACVTLRSQHGRL